MLRHFKALLYKGLTLRGFITAEHPELFPAGTEALIEGVRSGRIRWRETVTDGLERAPAAYLAMLRGEGLGKRLVAPTISGSEGGQNAARPPVQYGRVADAGAEGYGRSFVPDIHGDGLARKHRTRETGLES